VQYENLDVEAMVVRTDKSRFAVRFLPNPEVRKKLIQHIYAGPYDSEVRDVRPSRVATAIFGRVFS
jgi:hypothetical protein